MSQEDTINAFFEEVGRLEFGNVERYFHEQAVYEDMPIEGRARAVGPAAIREKLGAAFVGVTQLPQTIHEIATNGDTVLIERTEVWHHETGEEAPLDVMSVIKFEGGKMILWRDYWDVASLMKNQPATWLEKVGISGD